MNWSTQNQKSMPGSVNFGNPSPSILQGLVFQDCSLTIAIKKTKIKDLKHQSFSHHDNVNSFRFGSKIGG